MNSVPKKFARGFSLIEVLIAVVILSIGLLALASLQLSMIRSSATTKAQTTAAGLAKDKIEAIRSFQTLDGYRLIPVAPLTETLTDASGDLGGVTFTRVTSATRYIYNKTDAAFEAIGNYTTDATIAADTDLVAGKDFKRISVTVTWTDATGAVSTVAMEDVVDSLDPADSANILASNTNTSGPRKVEEKIADPALDAMVIPIAVGGGTESAASNPKPTVFIGTNTVETRFDVLTYAGVNNGTATVQAKVETAMVGCKCAFDASIASTVRGKRPTYWNGFRYAVPLFVDTSGTASYKPPAKADPATTGQSNLCGICCRDHFDPVDVKGATFSPRKVTKNSSDVVTGTTHEHFRATSPTAWTAALTTGVYDEACRVIRVDGIWSIAADLENDYFGLLATQELSAAAYYASGSSPDATATDNYQAFVVGYLDARYTNNATSSTYNTLLSGTSLSDLETTHTINAPASISIADTFTGGTPVVRNISSISQANPGVVTTTTNHTYVTGDRVTFSGVGGMTQLNGKSFIITVLSGTTFQLATSTASFTAYTSGGTTSVNHAKWLHSRGLYIDYLEKDAVDAVLAAKTNCSSQSGPTFQSCVLTVLPFTSINLTELADWSTSDDDVIIVANNIYKDTLTSAIDPVRGKTTVVASAADGATANAITLSRKSNSGLLDLQHKSISASDADPFTDTQPFVASNPSAPAAVPDTFYVKLSLAHKTNQVVNWVTSTNTDSCSYVAATDLHKCKVNPATGLGVTDGISIDVLGYNFATPHVTNTTVTSNVANCTGPLPGFPLKTYTVGTSIPNPATYTGNTCSNYDITLASKTLPTPVVDANGSSPYAVSNSTKANESTRINFVMVNGDTDTADSVFEDQLGVTFGSITNPTPTLTCTYHCNNRYNNSGNPTDCKSTQAPIFVFTSSCN